MRSARTTRLKVLTTLTGFLVMVTVVSVFLARLPAAAMPSDARADRSQTASGPRPAATYELGKALFMGKGCARCHSHADVGSGLAIGPDLTGLGSPSSGLASDPGYLRSWLRDPQAIRRNTVMPGLDLSDEEIDRLLAFLLSGPGESPSAKGVR